MPGLSVRLAVGWVDRTIGRKRVSCWAVPAYEGRITAQRVSPDRGVLVLVLVLVLDCQGRTTTANCSGPGSSSSSTSRSGALGNREEGARA